MSHLIGFLLLVWVALFLTLSLDSKILALPLGRALLAAVPLASILTALLALATFGVALLIGVL